MYETRLSLARHHSPYDNPEDTEFPEVSSPLEGQIADVADRIAYNCHDLEDGMRAKLIDTEDLKDISLFREAYEKIDAGQIKDSSTRRIRTAKAIIDILVSNCIETSRKNISDSKVQNLEDVYNCEYNLITVSQEKVSELNRLEEFLFNYFYKHPRIAESAKKSRRQIETIFSYYCKNPGELPARFQDNIASEGLERTVCDYIAGMTDRYCLKIFSQISGE
jgi:dGTPase